MMIRPRVPYPDLVMISCSIPRSYLEALDYLAKSYGVSRSAAVRATLTDGLNNLGMATDTWDNEASRLIRRRKKKVDKPQQG